MNSHQSRASFLLIVALSLLLVSCKGGGGGGGGNGGGANNSIVFQISLSHTGDFAQGQQGATYTITVTNVGKAATASNVQVNVTVPSGETVVSMAGSGWFVPGMGVWVAIRGDSLAAGQSWPSITVTVNVAANATSPQVMMASVTGGLAQNMPSAQDPTNITSANVSILFGQYAFLFSGFDANGAVSIAGSINVDANGNLTGEEDFKDPTTLHTAQSVTGNCANFQVAATGFCNLTAAGKTSRYDFVLRNNGVGARLAEDPFDGASNTGSGILINQVVPPSNALTSAGGFNGYFSVGFSGTDAAGGRIGVEGNIFTNLSAMIAQQPGFLPQADVNDNGTLILPPQPTSNVNGNFTPLPAPTVDVNGRATMTMTISNQRTLTLALYILAPEVPASAQSGRAFAIDITPIATSAQVLSGQFISLGSSAPGFTSSSISGPNVFALWGVVPGAPAKSITTIGILNATAKTLLLDTNNAGTVNAGGPAPPPLAGTVTAISGPTGNGRAMLLTTAGGTTYQYVLYLDAANDGNIMGVGVTSADTTVSFGFFTGQTGMANFDNTHITGTYTAGTVSPVLPGVPNGVSPNTLTPTGQCSAMTCNGTFSAGAVSGNYSFSQTTGRGTATANMGQQFLKNTNNVFYIINPNYMVVMGADQGVTTDYIGILQF